MKQDFELVLKKLKDNWKGFPAKQTLYINKVFLYVEYLEMYILLS